MIDGIKEIVVDNGELIVHYKDGAIESFNTILQEVSTYITNLEEENDRLKKALCKDNIVPKRKYDYLKRQKESLELDLSCIKDYKSRCEKAIEYITTNICDIEFMKKEYEKHLIDFEVDTTFNDIEKLLNILQGVGKDE